jgi:ADP-ribose pyrophosphatase YjhB (NUDIX family)
MSSATFAVPDKEVKIRNAVIALFFQREVYLVNLNYNKGWTFPGGLIDKKKGETSYDAAFREFDEETGISPRRFKEWVEQQQKLLNPLVVTNYMYGQSKYHTDIFVIQCGDDKPSIDYKLVRVKKDENGQPETVGGKWYSIDNLPDNLAYDSINELIGYLFRGENPSSIWPPHSSSSSLRLDAASAPVTSFRNPLKAAVDARKAIAALESSSSIFEPFRALYNQQNYLQFRQRMDNPDDPFQIVGKSSTDCIIVESQQGLGPYDNPDMKLRLVNHSLYLGNLMLLHEQDVIDATLTEFNFVLQNAAINEQMNLLQNDTILFNISTNYFDPKDSNLKFTVTTIPDNGWCFYETVLTAVNAPQKIKGRHLAMCITWFIKNGTNAAFQLELDKPLYQAASTLSGIADCRLTNGELVTILSVENFFDKKFAAIFPVTDIIGSITSLIIDKNIIIFNDGLVILGIFKRKNDEDVSDLQEDNNNIYIQQLGGNHFNLIQFEKNPFTPQTSSSSSSSAAAAASFRAPAQKITFYLKINTIPVTVRTLYFESNDKVVEGLKQKIIENNYVFDPSTLEFSIQDGGYVLKETDTASFLI